jgi:CubicO group peptidase (beta-lactamase class C family)
MEELSITPSPHDFSAVRSAMQRYVDQSILPGASWAVLKGREVLDVQCVGWADIEAQIPLRPDHVFRAMSNTKLVTSCAVLLLWEDGKIGLDDAIEKYIPQLGNRQALKPGATRLDDTEPARSSITIRHLLTHSSGLSYGLLDPGTLMYKAYTERRVLNTHLPLARMMDTLADLPLLFHPGTAWEYSVSMDVLGYLVEVVSGQGLDTFFQSRIFDPLGMEDTTFTLPADKHARMATCYMGADLMDPMKPGLTPMAAAPLYQIQLQPTALLMGGGGLATTLPDMVALMRSLLPGGKTLLKPQTLALMMSNQLPGGMNIQFAGLGEITGKGHGLGGAVTLKPSSIDPKDSEGEFQWGGMAGTHWWISPRTQMTGLLMTQRHMGFWNPYAFEFKQRVYRAMGSS